MKKNYSIHCVGMLCLLLLAHQLDAQSSDKKNKILIDIAHGQKFWNDPSAMDGKDPAFIERVKYMTKSISETATSVNADIGYIREKITPVALAKCDLLFIHLPSSAYDADEANAIKQYVEKGGALFLAMDANFWSTLQQTNANAIISPSGLAFGEDSPDQSDGGYSKPNIITSKAYKIPYHGGRVVSGGTPFCYFNDGSDKAFGMYTNYKKGKVVAMGDGMVSLYMNEWKDVNDYQCNAFMQDVFAWLLK